MQHAADRFERQQSRELERIPFAIEEMEIAPNFIEVIGWIFLAFCFGVLFVGFLGM